MEKDYDSLTKRNDELETQNIDLRRLCDVNKPLSTQFSLLQPSQPKKSSSKSRGKKATPRSPLQQHRILRSYNGLNSLNSTGPTPFSKGFINKTLNPSGMKRSVLQTQNAGINCSMNDITHKSIANCMINNLYFLPKNPKK